MILLIKYYFNFKAASVKSIKHMTFIKKFSFEIQKSAVLWWFFYSSSEESLGLERKVLLGSQRDRRIDQNLCEGRTSTDWHLLKVWQPRGFCIIWLCWTYKLFHRAVFSIHFSSTISRIGQLCSNFSLSLPWEIVKKNIFEL